MRNIAENAAAIVTVKVTREMAELALRQTDWAAIDAQTDEDIARNVASNPDAATISVYVE